MKKLFLLLLIFPFLFSCGDDDEEYLDHAIIEGTWMWEYGLYNCYYIFEDNTCRELWIDKYTGDTSSSYPIYYKEYKLTKDYLYITKQNNTQIYTRYIMEGDTVIYLWNSKYVKVPPLTNK